MEFDGDYGAFFKAGLERLKEDGNYRFFANLERRSDAFPNARRHTEDGPQDVLVWCSNDYLGMVGPSLELLGSSLEVLRLEGLIEPVGGKVGDDVPMRLTETGRDMKAMGCYGSGIHAFAILGWFRRSVASACPMCAMENVTECISRAA